MDDWEPPYVHARMCDCAMLCTVGCLNSCHSVSELSGPKAAHTCFTTCLHTCHTGCESSGRPGYIPGSVGIETGREGLRESVQVLVDTGFDYGLETVEEAAPTE